MVYLLLMYRAVREFGCTTGSNAFMQAGGSKLVAAMLSCKLVAAMLVSAMLSC